MFIGRRPLCRLREGAVVMEDKRRIVALVVGLLLLVGVCATVVCRIVVVNAEALTVPVDSYELGEEVALDGSFVTVSKEATKGYSLTVDSVRQLSPNDYVSEHGRTNVAVEGFDQKSIVEVNVTIANDGNAKGYLDVMGYRLVPERGNEYYVVDSSLWRMVEPNAPGDTSVLTLAPDSEYSVSIPFVRNASGDEAYSVPIDDRGFTLHVADALVAKTVVLSL